jgi:transaldolase / glucose-6-phosphate isomerase
MICPRTGFSINILLVKVNLMLTTQINPIAALAAHGQSVWLDYIRRSLITSGELQALITEGGVSGVTSNPSIFQKAIAGSKDYDACIAAIEATGDLEAISLYEHLAITDVQAAADLLYPLYEHSHYHDGYVSLEVSPYLANDTEATLSEARRLWQDVGRANLMIKVPATPAGIPAIQQLIGEGINVNVTLLFAQDAYEQVANAYISGLEHFVANGGNPGRVASVASFFISRIDSAIDALLAAKIKAEPEHPLRQQWEQLLGKAAIANAKLTYQRYREIYDNQRWQALEAQGAQPQRLLWASTGTKNPQYRDVMYVEELIGAETVNTVPPATLMAFRDHGQTRPSLTEDLEAAQTDIQNLERAGISLQAVTTQLLQEGLQLFSDAFDQLLSAVEQKREAVLAEQLDRCRFQLPANLLSKVQSTLEDWRVQGKIRHLWQRDARLWTGTDEGEWLDWLGITDDQLAHLQPLKQLAAEVKTGGYAHIVLLGMGGSSLCPEVLKLTFGQIDGFPELLILDSTDPAQIQALEAKINGSKTLFIVSSKSGSTLEPNIFKQYFFDQQLQTNSNAADHFIAITDPGSHLDQIARQAGFRQIFYGIPGIGGRYSALSNFGLVPAAAMGLDVAHFLNLTEEMVHSCASSVPPADNPGVVLGVILGVAAQQGRDKVTLVSSSHIGDLGAWLEQLLAESTGKEGKGLIPVDNEPLGTPACYGSDRLFVYLRLASAPDPEQDRAIAVLEQAGQPVVHIAVTDSYHLGQEFFRWQIATAVAGSVLGIHAFNQPDVEASKIATRQLTTAYEASGTLPPEIPLLVENNIALFADSAYEVILKKTIPEELSLQKLLRAHLDQLQPGDYFALLAYIQMNAPHQDQLQTIRRQIRDAYKVATCLGFGPRFLHSTGQAYKGGPNTGVFLQITCRDPVDLAVPGQKYSFGVVKAAQARGDFQVLTERHRRALRVHFDGDVDMGLKLLHEAIEQILIEKNLK